LSAPQKLTGKMQNLVLSPDTLSVCQPVFAVVHLLDLALLDQRLDGAAERLLLPLRVAPDYADATFNLALLLQRKNEYAEAADYWRRYLASDRQSEWAARARRSLKFCEMQVHLIVSPTDARPSANGAAASR